MENKPNLLETLKHLDFLNKTLSEVCELADKADMVFSNRSSLKTISELFDSTWKKLLDFEVRCSGIPYDIKMQPYDEINIAFLNVSDATIDRKTFKKILEPSSKAIDDFLNLVKEEIDRTENELSVIYDEFVKESSTELKFIFNEPRVKEIIINELLKS